MIVVIVGARRRSEREDEPLIHKLVDDLINRYPKLKIVGTSCDRGIGKILKNKCLPLGQKNPKAKLDFVEVMVRVYSPREELTKAELAEIYEASNAMLNENGDEYHVFVEEEPRGNMIGLIQRVKERGASLAIYRKGEAELKRPSLGDAK